MSKNINCNKINRDNDTGFSYLTNQTLLPMNMMTPDIFIGQFFIDEYETDTYDGVQIVKINSENNSTSSLEEAPEHKECHNWRFANGEVFKELEETFIINKKAREKRRLNQIQFMSSPASSDEKREDRNGYFIDTNLSYSDEPINNNAKIINPSNFFTIINKPFLSSESSTKNDRGDIEFLRTCEFPTQVNSSDNEFAEEINVYKHTDDIEKRTVWVYSFKNKPLLTEDDLEILNISNDTSSSSCTEELEEPAKDSIRCRVRSPVHIPRLNLCPTLPTVTEIAEPLKAASAASSGSTKSVHDNSPRHKINSWFAKKNLAGGYLDRPENSSNVINWMALTPRERRRRISAHSDVIIEGRIKTLEEVRTTAKTKRTLSKKDIEGKIFYDAQVQTDNEVNVIKRISDGDSNPKSVETNSIVISMNVREELTSNENNRSNEENNIRYEKKDRMKNRPRIKINKKSISKGDIKVPIENVNSNNWIIEENIDKKTAAFDYESDPVMPVNVHGDKVDSKTNATSNRLWTRNMSLKICQPTKWTEFSPITKAVPSINLSLSSNSYNDESCWRRFIKLFRCCK